MNEKLEKSFYKWRTEDLYYSNFTSSPEEIGVWKLWFERGYNERLVEICRLKDEINSLNRRASHD